ncbi:MAG TPA: glycosyltransferase family 39 protein [Candidatus Acidoferrum sp.]|nr:glycosyltransferase family 39 protein [Candidatus Acidoferrum sp.]
MLFKHTWAFLLLVILGVLFRLGFVLAADSRQLTFHSGGSDAPVYALLAENLLLHKGFTYAGQPSAFRPPGYPSLLAGFMEVFGHHYITAVRVLQFIVGLLTVVTCATIARRIFGREGQRATLVFGLYLPTLIFSTAQLMTECVSTFLTALFLLFLVEQQERGDGRSACGLGLIAGLESLMRFNAAILPFFALGAVIGGRRKGSVVLRSAAVMLLAALVVLPWMIRNASVFPGHVLYATHTGANAVQGVVNTEGRTQPGDTEKLKAAMGWCVQDLETNDSARLALPSETDLNRHALRVVPQLWREQGWNAVPLLAKKIADFWLSTDQFLHTQSLPATERAIRIAGVSLYWIVVAVAMGGLHHLRKTRPDLAAWVILYLVGITLVHLPFVMNTRLRIPLVEPLIIVLAGGGWVRLDYLIRHRHQDPDLPVAVAE